MICSRLVESAPVARSIDAKNTIPSEEAEVPTIPHTDIYALTDSGQCLGRSTVEVARAMMRAGLKILQYREKRKAKGEMLAECLELRRLTREAGCCFIVNDHVDLALACEADGVHVGQEDLPLPVVRGLVGPDKIIGISTHNMDEARAAVAGGADYIGAGAMFPTNTKKDIVLSGPAYLREVSAWCPVPVVAIGGINRRTLPEIIAAGARCCAMVTAITLAEDIPAEVASLRALMAAEFATTAS